MKRPWLNNPYLDLQRKDDLVMVRSIKSLKNKTKEHMKRNSYLNILKSALLTFLLFSSCNEGILEKSNPNELSTETFFQTQDQLQSAVNAIYAGLQANSLYNREYFFLHDMLSDENVPNPQLEAPRREVLTYNLNPGNLLINEVWEGLYRVIHRANLVIANAENVPEIEISDELRNRFEGEARFLRAWAYFELVSLWGPVPLTTEPQSEVVGLPRSPEADVYQVIFDDLQFAEENLDVKSDYPAEDLGRATKGAAQALAGKIRLWRGEFPEVITELEKVIESEEYTLDGVDYIENFREENENNAESIFEVQFTTIHGYGVPWNDGGDGQGVAEVTFRGQEYTPAPPGWNNVDPAPELLAAYDPTDPRYEANFYFNGESYANGDETMSLTRPGWQKYSNAYKQASEDQISGINFRVIRYADVLLMMAEAQNEVNGPADAIDYVNEVRARVGMPDLPTPGDKEAMFDIIANERRIELASEQIRNRDIRRWRRAGKLDSEPIANYRDAHDLLPIPTVEIDNNPALSSEDQNPGY